LFQLEESSFVPVFEGFRRECRSPHGAAKRRVERVARRDDEAPAAYDVVVNHEDGVSSNGAAAKE
jgi:hypothetical protein